jgi:PAS domain S-box-containing protein
MSLDPELAVHAVAAASDAIVTVDRTGKITSWNHGAEQLFGYSTKEAIGQTLILIIPPEHRPRHVAAFHAAMDSGHLANGGAVARVEAMTASGGSLTLGLSLGLLHDDPGNGAPAGAVAVLRPLTTDVIEFVSSAGQERQ